MAPWHCGSWSDGEKRTREGGTEPTDLVVKWDEVLP